MLIWPVSFESILRRVKFPSRVKWEKGGSLNLCISLGQIASTLSFGKIFKVVTLDKKNLKLRSFTKVTSQLGRGSIMYNVTEFEAHQKDIKFLELNSFLPFEFS